MLKYVIFVILLIILIFGLAYLAQKFMGKYGHLLVSRYGVRKEKKDFFESLDNSCLIAAFIFFIISLMPEINRVLFLTISVAFVLRALRGRISFLRALLVLIGGFSLGVALSLSGVGILAPAASAVLIFIAAVTLFFGFGKSVKRNRSGNEF